ncbi:hypothetical protein AX16_005862 [Volvariella volvacea WC 439]|nr:hypothetical protein AX16_005862 [Volvariella volvacea WC 439]
MPCRWCRDWNENDTSRLLFFRLTLWTWLALIVLGIVSHHIISYHPPTTISHPITCTLSLIHVSHSRTSPPPPPPPPPRRTSRHDIYKWQSTTNHRTNRTGPRARAASFSGSSTHPPHPAFEHIHEPGGFRRNYLLLRAHEQGRLGGDLEGGVGEEGQPRILNNFIDFLFLYGHFAGEDLEEDEDEEKSFDEEGEDEEQFAPPIPGLSETTPLLSSGGDGGGWDEGGGGMSASAITTRTSRSRSRRRAGSVGPHGNATVTQAVLMLLKSFIGTGVLFLGKAFMNGGLLFSSVTFVFIAFISLYSFLLLVKTKFVVSGSFGDIGGALYGPWMRYLILGSIVISQLGFVSAYTIFVAENLRAFVLGISNCTAVYSVQSFILLQLAVFLPLALVRDLAKLSTTALVADGFIFMGLAYIFGSEVRLLVERGVAEGVRLFNPRDFPLFIGTAVFSFEGIGLVIPITDAMREPRKFPAALTGVMMFLVVLFGGAGILAYLTFGSDIQTVVLVNLDTSSRMVQSVQFVYALAILLSVPLQFFPAVRILETGIFTSRSGKANLKIKWTKNLFRFGLVMVCTVISWVGAADLDKFVAFVGCFACVPLCYVYPAMLHYRACARTRREKAADWAMIVFGLIVAAYTTVQTVKLMLEPDTSGPPIFGNCDIPQT